MQTEDHGISKETVLVHQIPYDENEKKLKITEEEKFIINIEHLTSLCNLPLVKKLRLSNINCQLSDLIRQCEAVKSITDKELSDINPIKAENSTCQFAPNQKLDHQWQPGKLFRTKKPLKKTKGQETLTNSEKYKLIQKLKVTNTEQPLIPRINSSGLNFQLLKLGETNLYYSSFLSLEINFSKKESEDIATKIPNHKVGWLNDEIIDGFMFQLQKTYPNMIYCGCTESLAILHSKSMRLLWNGVNLNNVELVIIPFNQANTHWTLAVVKISSCEMLFLDPMKNEAKESDNAFKSVNKLFHQKFGKTIQKVSSPDHNLQDDSKSCGVLCCYYAEQICSGKFVTGDFATSKFTCSQIYILSYLFIACFFPLLSSDRLLSLAMIKVYYLKNTTGMPSEGFSKNQLRLKFQKT